MQRTGDLRRRVVWIREGRMCGRALRRQGEMFPDGRSFVVWFSCRRSTASPHSLRHSTLLSSTVYIKLVLGFLGRVSTGSPPRLRQPFCSVQRILCYLWFLLSCVGARRARRHCSASHSFSFNDLFIYFWFRFSCVGARQASYIRFVSHPLFFQRSG